MFLFDSVCRPDQGAQPSQKHSTSEWRLQSTRGREHFSELSAEITETTRLQGIEVGQCLVDRVLVSSRGDQHPKAEWERIESQHEPPPDAARANQAMAANISQDPALFLILCAAMGRLQQG
eukprot:16427789-Heterocapsa_arctica.AAC.1